MRVRYAAPVPVAEDDEVEVEVEVDVVAIELSDVDLEEEEDVCIDLAPPRRAPLRLDGMTALEKERSPWRAAGIAAASLAKALQARTVIIHSLDHRRDELRTVGVDGPRAQDLLGNVGSIGDDFIVAAVVANGRSMTLRLDGGLPRVAPERIAVVRGERSVTAVPIMCGPYCVGAIEIVDASGELVERVEEACSRVSEHLALLF